MAKGKHVGKDWSQDRAGAVEFVFNTHFWGNRSNSGKGEKGGYKTRNKVAKAGK